MELYGKVSPLRASDGGLACFLNRLPPTDLLLMLLSPFKGGQVIISSEQMFPNPFGRGFERRLCPDPYEHRLTLRKYKVRIGKVKGTIELILAPINPLILLPELPYDIDPVLDLGFEPRIAPLFELNRWRKEHFFKKTKIILHINDLWDTICFVGNHLVLRPPRQNMELLFLPPDSPMIARTPMELLERQLNQYIGGQFLANYEPNYPNQRSTIKKFETKESAYNPQYPWWRENYIDLLIRIEDPLRHDRDGVWRPHHCSLAYVFHNLAAHLCQFVLQSDDTMTYAGYDLSGPCPDKTCPDNYRFLPAGHPDIVTLDTKMDST